MSGAEGTRQSAVYVYQAPVRLWHWINAASIVTLAATGFFIAHPFFSAMGESAENFWMGTVRAVHFAAGYVLGFGFLYRMVFSAFGNHHARQIFTLPAFNAGFWGGVWHEIRWYAFAAREPRKYVGHNPLAQLAMFTMFTATMTVMIATGFAMYGEGAGAASWSHAVFTSWVLPLVGNNSMALHTVHHMTMWIMIVFVMVHIYAAIREDIMSRQSLVSTMISGWRMFKDDRP